MICFWDGLDKAEKILKVTAYLVGAFWVFYNFWKGRTFVPRLDIRVTGELHRGVKPEFAHISFELENKGLSKISLSQEGTGLRLSSWKSKNEWQYVTTLPIVERHEWIEPKEVIQESAFYGMDVLLEGPMKAEIIVIGESSWWRRVRRRSSSWEVSLILI